MLLLGSVHALWYYHVVQVVLSMLTLVLRTARCVSCSRSCSMPVPMRTVMHHVGPPAHSHTSCLLVFPPLQVSGRASESVDQAKQSSQEAWDHTKAASQETADKVRHGALPCIMQCCCNCSICKIWSGALSLHCCTEALEYKYAPHHHIHPRPSLVKLHISRASGSAGVTAALHEACGALCFLGVRTPVYRLHKCMTA